MEHQDRWLDLIERFVARGAHVSIGNMREDMIKHLLDTVEEQDVKLASLDARCKRLGERLEALESTKPADG